MHSRVSLYGQKKLFTPNSLIMKILKSRFHFGHMSLVKAPNLFYGLSWCKIWCDFQPYTVYSYFTCSCSTKHALTLLSLTHTQTHRCCPQAAWEPWDSWAKRWHGWAESRTAPPGWTSPGGWMYCHWLQNSRMCSSTLDYRRIPTRWSLPHLIHTCRHKFP